MEVRFTDCRRQLHAGHDVLRTPAYRAAPWSQDAFEPASRACGVKGQLMGLPPPGCRTPPLQPSSRRCCPSRRATRWCAELAPPHSAIGMPGILRLLCMPADCIHALCMPADRVSSVHVSTRLSTCPHVQVLCPHPRAKKCTIEAARIVRDAAVAAGAPRGECKAGWGVLLPCLFVLRPTAQAGLCSD